jgi:hypothetical protein
MPKHDDTMDAMSYITAAAVSLAIGALIVCLMIVKTLAHDEQSHDNTHTHDDP